MVRIVFGLIFFQDKQSIDRLLPTLPDYPIIAIDGRSLGYPSTNPLSTDGSRESLQKHGAIIIDSPDIMEWQKRDLYLREAERMKVDVLIVIDSDHQLSGNWQLLESQLKNDIGLYSMPIYTKGIDNIYRFTYMPLIISRPESFHYEERHDKICIDHIQQLPKGIINGVMQINNHNLRTSDRIAKGYIFKVISRNAEAGNFPAETLEAMKSIGW